MNEKKSLFYRHIKNVFNEELFSFFLPFPLSLGASVEMEIDERLIISLLSEAARNVQKEDINDC
jgi:hypothetical protein